MGFGLGLQVVVEVLGKLVEDLVITRVVDRQRVIVLPRRAFEHLPNGLDLIHVALGIAGLVDGEPHDVVRVDERHGQEPRIGLLAGLGLDSDSLFDLATANERARLKTEELVAKDRQVVDNLEGKQKVVRQLLDGRLTLREAAARFQELNEACSVYDWERFRETFPGRTDEERHCRQVLVAVRPYLDSSVSASRELLARLETELEESIASF